MLKSGYKNRRIINIILYVLVLTFTLQIINKTANTHSHILSDGTIITHAHPYNKTEDTTPFKSHHHSQSDLFCLAKADVYFPLLFLTLGIVVLVSVCTYITDNSNRIIQNRVISIPGRSPPLS